VTARDRLIVSAVVGVVAVVAAWLLIIQPKRNEASSLGSQVTTAEGQLASAQAAVTQARADQAAYTKNYTMVARLGEAVPSDDNVPSLIFQLQNAASHTNVDFRSLALVGTGTAAPGTTAGATPGTAAAAALPPGATVGPAGLPTMPFTFTFDGNFFHLSDFFGRLQKFVTATNKRISVSGRLMTLNSITLGPATGRGFPRMTATISATSYLVPANEGLTAGATPGGPASSQTVSNTSTTSSASPAAPATIGSPVK
jgi:hypothetical protein